MPAAYVRAVQNSWWFPQILPVLPPLCRLRLTGTEEAQQLSLPQALLVHRATPAARRRGGRSIASSEIRGVLVFLKWVGPCICFLHFLFCSGIKGCLALDLRKQNQGIPNWSYEMLPVCKEKLLGVFCRVECSLGTLYLASSLLCNSMRQARQTQPFETSKNHDLLQGAPAVSHSLNCWVHGSVGSVEPTSRCTNATYIHVILLLKEQALSWKYVYSLTLFLITSFVLFGSWYF